MKLFLFVIVFNAVVLPVASGMSVELRRLEHLFGEGSKSNCSRAVDMQYLRSKQLSLPIVERRVTSEARVTGGPDPVQYINAGFGTTGTTSVFQTMCDYNLTGTHWFKKCNLGGFHTSPAKDWRMGVYHCMEKPDRGQCIDKGIRAYPKALRDTLESAGAIWADTPAPEMFIDALLIGLSNMSVMITYRDPKVFARRRWHLHSMTLICNPVLWNHSRVLHPFDYISCLETRLDSPPLVKIRSMSIKEVEDAYIQMSTVVAFHALMSRRRFLPLCVFDSESHNPRGSIEEAFPELKGIELAGSNIS